MGVLAGETCFCCNSKLRPGEVWRGNIFVGLVSVAHIYFHWKQQIFTFRSVIYSSDKHYGLTFVLLDDANVFLLGGIWPFPGRTFWNRANAASSQGLGWIHPRSSRAETASITFQTETPRAAAAPESAVTQLVGWTAAFSHAEVNYIRSTFRRSNLSLQSHRLSIRLKAKLFILCLRYRIPSVKQWRNFSFVMVQ